MEIEKGTFAISFHKCTSCGCSGDLLVRDSLQNLKLMCLGDTVFRFTTLRVQAFLITSEQETYIIKQFFEFVFGAALCVI